MGKYSNFLGVVSCRGGDSETEEKCVKFPTKIRGRIKESGKPGEIL